LWGEIMLAMREHSVNSVKVIAVASHPDVIKRSVEFAQLPGGFRDREHIHTMLGASPDSQESVNIYQQGFHWYAERRIRTRETRGIDGRSGMDVPRRLRNTRAFCYGSAKTVGAW
jgi:hypothetical protein